MQAPQQGVWASAYKPHIGRLIDWAATTHAHLASWTFFCYQACIVTTTFAELGLAEPLLKAITALGHSHPTPIQAAAIPVVLTGRDVLGLAQTGTGKTASFALPMLQALMGSPTRAGPRGLVLAPTRELASQIDDHIRALGRFARLRSLVVTGGVGIHGQDAALRRGIDILVATPGRLLDHLQRGTIDLSHVQVAVLDEADRMLDMGFIRDIRRIVSRLPQDRQTLLFSATLSASIAQLTSSMMRNPQRVAVAPPSTAPRKVEQTVYPTGTRDKRAILLQLLAQHDIKQSIVFTRTKWDANKLTKYLEQEGHQAVAIHGNKSQNQRRQALQLFRDNKLQLLVATDIASRGIDVEGVSHVINYAIPNVPEDYVHRIGRTGRAERSGVALSLMSDVEAPLMVDIERLLGRRLPRCRIDGSALPDEAPRASVPKPTGGARPQRRSRR
jgi:ATP-dependent RNA helicase RhlE